jgi:hypothetical protein
MKMPKGKQKETDKTTVEVDEDLDFDDAVDEDEEVEETEIDFEALIKETAIKAKKQAMKYTDTRIAEINEKLEIHQKTLEAHTTSIVNLEQQMAQAIEALKAFGVAAPTPEQALALAQAAQQTGQQPKGILDTVFGTVGGVLHGVVDTAAFLCESVVDLVTLGKARRPQQ